MTSISNRNKHLFVTEQRVVEYPEPVKMAFHYGIVKKYMPEALWENMEEKYLAKERPNSLPRDFNEFLMIVKEILNKHLSPKDSELLKDINEALNNNNTSRNMTSEDYEWLMHVKDELDKKATGSLTPREHEILKFGKEALEKKAVSPTQLELLERIVDTLEKKSVKINLTSEDSQLLSIGRDVLMGKTVLFNAARNNDLLPLLTVETKVKKSRPHKKNKHKDLNKMVSMAKAEKKTQLLDITSKASIIEKPSKFQSFIENAKSTVRKALRTALSKAALL